MTTAMARSIRKTIERLDIKIEKLEKQREEALSSGQSSCRHPIDEIVEGKYEEAKGFYGSVKPEFRVCKLCGYAEEGWGCGFWKLRGDKKVTEIDRESAMKYVIGGINLQEELIKVRYHR